jgi:hypothetical protein
LKVDESRLPDHAAADATGHEQHRVVRDFAVARTNLERANPAILGDVDGEIRGREDVLAVSRDLDRRQGDDEIGLAQLPALGERRRFGLVGRIAARGTGIHPLHDRVDLRLVQPRVVGERAVRGIGKPRRHLPLRDFLLDRSRPWPHFVIGAQRHRRDLARPVTRDAIGVENRRHVFGERRRCGRGRRLRRASWRLRVYTENNRRQEHADEK